jgi:peptidyl-prolyl cis-trans isomerase SurA
MRFSGARTDAPEPVEIVMPRITARHRSIRRWLANLLFAAAFAMPVAAGAQVVVVANGSPITAYDIEQRMKLDAAATHKASSRKDVINELIDDRIKIAKAKVYGLEVSDTEVENSYNNMAKAQHITPEQFGQFLGRAGVAPNTIKARIRAELTWGQLIRGKYASTLEVGESDITKAMHDRNETQTNAVGYIYTLYPVIVVIPPGSSPAVVENKQREAESLRGRFTSCKEGLAFSHALRDVAVREPINRSSADLAPQLRELLGNMEVGRLTPPETTAQGLQMFAVCEKKESKTDSPIKTQLRQELFAKRFENEAKKYLEEIRKQAMIEYK